MFEQEVAAKHRATVMTDRASWRTKALPEFGINDQLDFSLTMRKTLRSEVGDFSLSSPVLDSRERWGDRPDHRRSCPNMLEF